VGNLYDDAPLGIPSPVGFTSEDARLLRAVDGLMRPGPSSPAIDAAMGAFGVEMDLDGQARTGLFDVGCDETGAPGPTRAPLTRDEVGPTRWRPMLR
jgi:poly(beta-D-mannuronate) lyase